LAFSKKINIERVRQCYELVKKEFAFSNQEKQNAAENWPIETRTLPVENGAEAKKGGRIALATKSWPFKNLEKAKEGPTNWPLPTKSLLSKMGEAKKSGRLTNCQQASFLFQHKRETKRAEEFDRATTNYKLSKQ